MWAHERVGASTLEVITGQEQQGKGLPVNHTARSSSSLVRRSQQDGAGVAGLPTASGMDDSVLIQTEVVLLDRCDALHGRGQGFCILCFDNFNAATADAPGLVASNVATLGR